MFSWECSDNKFPILNIHFRFLFVETSHALSLRSIATKRTIKNGEHIFQLFLREIIRIYWIRLFPY